MDQKEDSKVLRKCGTEAMTLVGDIQKRKRKHTAYKIREEENIEGKPPRGRRDNGLWRDENDGSYR